MNISWSFIIQICYSICNILKSPWKYQQDFWVQQVGFFHVKKTNKQKKNPKQNRKPKREKPWIMQLSGYQQIFPDTEIHIPKPLSLKDCTIAQWMEKWNNGGKKKNKQKVQGKKSPSTYKILIQIFLILQWDYWSWLPHGKLKIYFQFDAILNASKMHLIYHSCWTS